MRPPTRPSGWQTSGRLWKRWVRALYPVVLELNHMPQQAFQDALEQSGTCSTSPVTTVVWVSLPSLPRSTTHDDTSGGRHRTLELF